jgi:hypothetical protein
MLLGATNTDWKYIVFLHCSERRLTCSPRYVAMSLSAINAIENYIALLHRSEYYQSTRRTAYELKNSSVVSGHSYLVSDETTEVN